MCFFVKPELGAFPRGLDYGLASRGNRFNRWALLTAAGALQSMAHSVALAMDLFPSFPCTNPNCSGDSRGDRKLVLKNSIAAFI